MRVIISAGGTGGHLYPALALAAEIASRDSENKILFITGAGAAERKLPQDAGFETRAIDAPGIRRKLSAEAFGAALKITRAAAKAAAIIKEFNPDAVVGFGGAVTYPVIRAAAKAGIPTVIQEQNVIPGMANKYLSRLATFVAIAGPEAAEGWPRGRDIRVTGNPVRLGQLDLPRGEARQELGLDQNTAVVTVFGGSQGAKHINEAVVGAYRELDKIEGLQLLHITGTRDFDETVKAWSAAGASGKVKLLPYLDGMGAAYRASDLVVCRAGASTLAEVGAYGVPAILIPYPYAANNHQAKNAASPESAGAALVIKDEDLNAEILTESINLLIRDPARLRSMAEAMKKTARPNAARDLANLVIEAANTVK
jgi:UDP-N-acetylglucosamine--N-acetylmuramyl-(pentapeptide) pyrophosphoryl-undecaprenol N-acetylglucosamine transferase